jgi:Icc protein
MPIHVTPISRRRFLAGTLATGAGMLLPSSVWSAESSVDPNRWALTADTHICEDRERIYRDVKPAENFAKAACQIISLKNRPAGLIVAGDCAAIEGKPGDYAVLAEDVQPLRKTGVPVHFALGNHDHRKNFFAAFPETVPEGKRPVPDRHISILETPHADIFLLDSLEKTNYTPGRLGKPQLQWLAKALNARDKPALLVAHHHPLSLGKHGLLDMAALYDVIVPRKQVKAFFFGHSHRWHRAEHEGIHLVNLPATAWLFDKSQPRGWVDTQLKPDGATLVLHALDPKHPKDGETVPLKWRS